MCAWRWLSSKSSFWNFVGRRNVSLLWAVLPEIAADWLCPIFLDKIDIIKQADFLSSNQDCPDSVSRPLESFRPSLRCTADFNTFNRDSQLDENCKWIHCFNDGTTIIVMGTISKICRRPSNLFKCIGNNQQRSTVFMILFLKKQYLMAKKDLAGKLIIVDHFLHQLAILLLRMILPNLEWTYMLIGSSVSSSMGINNAGGDRDYWCCLHMHHGCWEHLDGHVCIHPHQH